jgi:hypothetical protein
MLREEMRSCIPDWCSNLKKQIEFQTLTRPLNREANHADLRILL